MDELAGRRQRAAESLLENEGLTSNLDDAAAGVLLQWGMDCAGHIVQDTEGMTDDKAEEAMYRRMRALRRMLRQVDRWMPGRGEADADANVVFLSKMAGLAAIVYDQKARSVQGTRVGAFLPASLGGDPAQAIYLLRQFIENLYQGENTR